MILSGRNGSVKYDPTGVGGATLAEIISLNTFKLSQKTDHIEVTSFGDANKVYVPGMADISGDLGGFWNSEEIALFEAVSAVAPGMLELTPSTTEPLFKWSGLAYLDADIEVGVSDAPKVTGSFMAAGPWTFAHTP